MMTKDEFIDRLNAAGSYEPAMDSELEEFDRLADAAREVQATMPGIGLFSVSNRLNCFMAVCRHLDDMIDDGRLSLGDTHVVLSILRLKDKRFLKAITMFDIRWRRYGAAARADMPRTTREYMAGLQMFG